LSFIDDLFSSGIGVGFEGGDPPPDSQGFAGDPSVLETLLDGSFGSLLSFSDMPPDTGDFSFGDTLSPDSLGSLFNVLGMPGSDPMSLGIGIGTQP
jgi:hypothetical protein